jgi:hypothetical protein
MAEDIGGFVGQLEPEFLVRRASFTTPAQQGDSRPGSVRRVPPRASAGTSRRPGQCRSRLHRPPMTFRTAS